MALDPAPLEAIRQTLATGVAAALEIPTAYASPEVEIASLPALLVHPGGHDDYIAGEPTTAGSWEGNVALLFHQADGDHGLRLVQLEAWYWHLPAAIEGLADDLAAAGADNVTVLRRHEPRLTPRQGKPRLFTGQADVTFDLTDPNC